MSNGAYYLYATCIEFPDYISDELNKIATVMARDLEYAICEAAYSSFHTVCSTCMEMSFFSNVHTMRNAMDQARMNLAVWTFERFAIKGEFRDVCMVADLSIGGPERGNADALIATANCL